MITAFHSGGPAVVHAGPCGFFLSVTGQNDCWSNQGTRRKWLSTFKTLKGLNFPDWVTDRDRDLPEPNRKWEKIFTKPKKLMKHQKRHLWSETVVLVLPWQPCPRVLLLVSCLPLHLQHTVNGKVLIKADWSLVRKVSVVTEPPGRSLHVSTTRLM